jgi:tetratricopeptide (TPR) repeat protein
MTTKQPKNSPMRRRRVVVAMSVALAAAGGVAGVRSLQSPPTLLAITPTERAAVSASTTSREGLSQAMATLTARVAANVADDQAAVALADVLMRQARVGGDGSLPRRAEAALTRTIAATDSYLGRRMLGAVYLAQHRFLAALEAGRKARQMRPDDPWNYGVIGDAAIELGRYDEAFAAFDRMASLKPTSAAYARIAYARELQGNLDGAVTAMRIAIEATSPQDPEAIAWAWSQLGALHLQMGDVDEAAAAYDRALFAFPRYPYARAGVARVAIARGDVDRGLAIYREQLAEAPTPELAAQIGDLLQRRGDEEGARAGWAEAERLELDGWKHESPQPAALARLLAERGLKAEDAVRLAREAARDRDDIFTNDALAWSLYRTGAFDEAWAASERARRTGTRDRRILFHAAAIAAARGDKVTARAFATRALEGHQEFDLLAAPAASALLASLSATH